MSTIQENDAGAAVRCRQEAYADCADRLGTGALASLSGVPKDTVRTWSTRAVDGCRVFWPGFSDPAMSYLESVGERREFTIWDALAAAIVRVLGVCGWPANERRSATLRVISAFLSGDDTAWLKVPNSHCTLAIEISVIADELANRARLMGISVPWSKP